MKEFYYNKITNMRIQKQLQSLKDKVKITMVNIVSYPPYLELVIGRAEPGWAGPTVDWVKTGPG